jgi:hypothetical protein
MPVRPGDDHTTTTGQEEGGGGLVRLLGQEIAKRDEWLQSARQQTWEVIQRKDEQMRQLRAEMLQLLQIEREQMLALLQAKDAQMRAKDEQIHALMSGSLAGQLSMTSSSASPWGGSRLHQGEALPRPHQQPVTIAHMPPTSPMLSPAPEQARWLPEGEPPAPTPAAPETAPAQSPVPAPETVVAAARQRLQQEPIPLQQDPTRVPDEITNGRSVPTLDELAAGGESGAAAVAAVLEHGLEALESAVSRGPRKDRQTARRLCERAEAALEELLGVGTGPEECVTTGPMWHCETDAPELRELHDTLVAVAGLRVGMTAGAECVGAVNRLLDVLKRCRDPVVGAGRALSSGEQRSRMHGLETLRNLPRVLLDENVEAEVSLAPVAAEMASGEDRSNEERMAAYFAFYALWFRNEHATSSFAAKFGVEVMDELWSAVFSGRLRGKQGAALCAGWGAIFVLLLELATKSETAELRATYEKTCIVMAGKSMKLDCPAAQFEDLLVSLLKHFTDSDLALATGASVALVIPMMASGNADVIIASQEWPRSTLELYRRSMHGQLEQPVGWWKERASVVHLDSVFVTGAQFTFGSVLVFLATLPPDAAYEEMLVEGIHMLKVNHQAHLGAQPRCPCMPIFNAAKIVGVAARESSRHEALVASGVVEALTWGTKNSFTLLRGSLAEYTAGATVALIGRNEGGHTLTVETVNCVLDPFGEFFDTTSTNYRVQKARKSPVKRMVNKATPIVDMCIADANKPHILAHATAVDNLMKGLLVDDDEIVNPDRDNPRRGQASADKLQKICALVLQNLALSDVGKDALRSREDVMEALRKVASVEGGLTDQARLYASGALFELDEEARQIAKAQRSQRSRQRNRRSSQLCAADIAAAVAAAGSTCDTDDVPSMQSINEDTAIEAVDHIMLSYNWGHQDVIKRINASLKARSYR